jgi:hypothetical protein
VNPAPFLRQASRLSLLLVLLGSPQGLLWGQTCSSQACLLCTAEADAALLGCGLAQGAGPACIAAAEEGYQLCINAASSVPTSPPPPPSPATPSCPPLPSDARPLRDGLRPSLVPCIVLVDPVPDLIDEPGTGVITNALSANTPNLATGGTVVRGIVADSAARLVLRIYANSPGDILQVQLMAAPGDNVGNPNSLPAPFGTLQTILPADGTHSGTQVTVTAMDTGAGVIAFALYSPPQDFSRDGADDSASSRSVTIQVTSSVPLAGH